MSIEFSVHERWAKPLGAVESVVGHKMILTGEQYIPIGGHLVRVETWTSIPDGMEVTDLGTKFRASATALNFIPLGRDEVTSFDQIKALALK